MRFRRSHAGDAGGGTGQLSDAEGGCGIEWGESRNESDRWIDREGQFLFQVSHKRDLGQVLLSQGGREGGGAEKKRRGREEGRRGRGKGGGGEGREGGREGGRGREREGEGGMRGHLGQERHAGLLDVGRRGGDACVRG